MEPKQFTPMSAKEQMAADMRLINPEMNDKEIGEVIGEKDSKVKRIFNKPAVRVYMESYLDKAGATREESARVIADAHKAVETKIFAFEGHITDEKVLIDHGTRLDAAKLNLQIRGDLKEGAQVQFNQFVGLTDEQLAKIASGNATAGEFYQDNGI